MEFYRHHHLGVWSVLDKSPLLWRRGNSESIQNYAIKTSNVTLVHFSRSVLEAKGVCVGDFKLGRIVLFLCSSLSFRGICNIYWLDEIQP